MSSYSEYETSPRVILPWLRGEWGKRWQQAWAVLRDSIAESAHQAVRCGWLVTAPTDALAKHADASQLFRGAFERPEQFRARLLKRWEYQQWRGSKKGIIDAISWAIAGHLGIEPTACNIQVIDNWQWMRAAFTDYGISSVDTRPYWIVIRQPHPFGTDGWYWGDGTVWAPYETFPDTGAATGGKHWGTNGTGNGEIVDLILRLAMAQKPAHARLVEIIVVLAGDIDSMSGEPTSGSKVLYWRIS